MIRTQENCRFVISIFHDRESLKSYWNNRDRLKFQNLKKKTYVFKWNEENYDLIWSLMKRENRKKSKYLYIIIIKNCRRNINSMSPKLFCTKHVFLTLRVKCSIRRYWYLNAHRLMIVVRDSRTSIQIWNTKIWSHSSDGAIFNISISFHSLHFFDDESFSVFIWKFLQSMSDVLHVRFGRL